MLDGSARARAYRDAYDRLRGHVPDPAPEGMRIDADGPVLRLYGTPGFAGIVYSHLGGLTGVALDAFIARQVAFFAERGEKFEWKYHAHDAPADLPERLVAAGFAPDDTETVLVGEAAELAVDALPPPGVRLREVTSRVDFERIEALESEVWAEDRSHLADMLAGEHAADPDALLVVVAEAGADPDEDDDPGRVVSAGWLRYETGTEFASLWGGSTLEAWRKRGIYRALVAYRARRAVERGYRYLQVDASDDSRPILTRLGLLPIATTVPYMWHPPR